MFANVCHFPHMCGKSHWHAYFRLSYLWTDSSNSSWPRWPSSSTWLALPWSWLGSSPPSPSLRCETESFGLKCSSTPFLLYDIPRRNHPAITFLPTWMNRRQGERWPATAGRRWRPTWRSSTASSTRWPQVGRRGTPASPLRGGCWPTWPASSRTSEPVSISHLVVISLFLSFLSIHSIAAVLPVLVGWF